MEQQTGYARLGAVSLGLAVGTTAAIYIFLLGLSATFFGWGTAAAIAFSSVFIGYGPSFVGSFTGAVWAFFDGFIAGCLIAFFYNRFLFSRSAGKAHHDSEGQAG
jgi:hypothetical protein